jgi:hypothetical protein
MFQAMTNIDELEIHDTFRAKIELGEHADKYETVEWVAIDDSNSGNYLGPIKFDTTCLTALLPVYREAYVSFPIKAVSSTGAAYTADTRLAFKCSVLSLVHSLFVRPTGSGPRIINENQGQMPLINNLRLLTESDIDWIECSGEELHFFGCDRNVSQNVMGQGVAGTATPAHVSVGTPLTDVYTNGRLADRVSVLTSSSDHSNGTTFNMIINIPLKYIHSFFDQLSFVLPNYPMKIEFGLSAISPSCDGFMPMVCPTGSTVGFFDATGAPRVQAALPAAPAPKLSIDPSITIGGFSLGACRLYVKCVTFAGKDAEKLDRELSSGYKKQITYLETDIVQMDNNGTGLATSISGMPYHQVFGKDTLRPVRLWAMFPPHGDLGKETSLFPGTVGPCYMQDCNVKINGKPLRPTNWMNQLELYNELREYQLGSGYRSQQGAQISFSDFRNGTRPYLFDLSRNASVINNLPVTFTLDGRLYDSAGAKVDAIFLIERYQTCFLDISRNKATTTVETGLAK